MKFICSVFNVQSVVIDVLNVSFTTTQDHSKWAVSNPKQGSYWLCVGDINRMVGVSYSLWGKKLKYSF